jgi:hypothetical protein
MNQQLKSYKTVEQIAKKHRMDVSDIQKQLDMGAPIEHEHTKNQKLAVEIALQHLDEFPDYYTRLKKMEADAKKEHKKFKDVKEDAVTDLQRGIVELDDASYDSIDSLMRRIMKKRKVTAKQLHDDFVKKHKETPDTWAKKNMKEEENGLWLNIRLRREKGLPRKKPGEKGYPETLDIKEGLKQARKNVGASKCWPGRVAKDTKIKNGIEVPDCKSVNSESTDALDYTWNTPVRERADRYCPKCEKLETRTECKYGSRYWDTFSLPAELISSKKDYNITMPHPGNFPESFDHKIDPEKFKKVKETSVAKKLRRMSTNQQGQLPKEMVKKVLKTDLPRFKEDVTIEDADGNTFIEIIDLIKPEKIKTFNQFVTEAKKSEMKCNSPKAEPVGDSLTGKSHVVKACENGKEKLIRFGQRGVKGSPKKDGESKAYASRRNRFQTRHAKNIAKGKMSAAYWANKVKW